MPRIRIRTPELPTAPVDTPEVDSQDEGPGLGTTLAGGALALGAGVLASRMPGLLGKLARGAQSLRQQSMLSGLAVPKSILGNIGAGVVASAERGSLAPIREVLSPQTFREAVANYRANVPYPGATSGPKWLPTPGRIMGATDEATQAALRRAGLTAEEAAREVLQAPLTGPLKSALDSPAAQYLIPFRRTPFNQFTEGLETLKLRHPAVTGAAAGAGAIHGAATSDERYPLSLGLGTAFASRYGLPYALGALAGRKLAGAETSAGIAGSILPVSEYGISSSVEDPLRPLMEPAALAALRRFAGGED